MPDMAMPTSVAVSTHSRLKAAGVSDSDLSKKSKVSTHSRLKAAGLIPPVRPFALKVFQHTAA